MTEILPFLKSLLSAPGLSAHEFPVYSLIEKEWTPLVDEISASRLGSLHALKRGSVPRADRSRSAKKKRPSLLIAAHMDAVGLMVKKIVDGFLYVVEVGGIDPRILPGAPVMVHGTKDLYGVVAMRSGDLLPDHVKNREHDLEYLLIDTGLSARDVSKYVRVGDVAAYHTEPIELSGETVSGHSLDNRASVAALTVCLNELQSRHHVWDVWFVASTQEEVTMSGAYTSAFQLKPDIAIAVDVTFGKGPGADGWDTFAIGEGPALMIGPNIHTFLHNRMKDVAEKAEIPFSVEIAPRHSGTDAYMMQVAAEGIPTMCVSIPLRYMHTPVELVSMKDIRRAGRLLAEFIASLKEDFVEKIVWD